MLPGSCHLPDVYSLENKVYKPFTEQPVLTDISLRFMQEFRVDDLQCVVVLDLFFLFPQKPVFSYAFVMCALA